MGYYTSHMINITDAKDTIPEKTNEQVFEEMLEDEDIGYAFSDGMDFWGESCKGYDLDQAILEFSKKYPDKIFIVDGDGEESLDRWQTAFRNGRYKSVKATMPDLDISDL